MSEAEFVSAIELDKGLLVKILVAGLHEVGLRLQVSILRFVELGDGSLTVFVFRLHQLEGVLGTLQGFFGRFLLRLRIQGIVVHLLDFLIERLLCVVELQLLVFLLDTGIADVVARLETVEDGDAEVQADVLTEIVLQLGRETIALALSVMMLFVTEVKFPHLSLRISIISLGLFGREFFPGRYFDAPLGGGMMNDHSNNIIHLN